MRGRRWGGRGEGGGGRRERREGEKGGRRGGRSIGEREEGGGRGQGDAIVSYSRSQAPPSFPLLAVPYWK